MLTNIFKLVVKFYLEIISLLILLIVIILISSFGAEDLIVFFQDLGVIAPILYIILHIIGGIIAPLGMSPLFVSGWFVFGNALFLYEFISTSIISIANFYIARRYGKKYLKKLIGDRGVDSVSNILQRINNKTLYIIRFFTFSSNDYASFAFGLTNIDSKIYVFLSIIANAIWCIALLVFFNLALDNYLMFIIWFLAGGLPVLLIYRNLKSDE